MKHRVTLKDIANAVGVSIGTVDRAINNRVGINEDVKQTIIAKAKEMGYVKNTFASTLSKKTKKKVAVIIPANPEFFWGKLYNGMKEAEKEFGAYGLEFIYYSIRDMWIYKEEQILYFLNDVIEQNIDILIMTPLNSNSIINKVKEIQAENIPVITVNEEFDESVPFLFHVGADNTLCGRLAGELVAKFIGGCGNILIVINMLAQEYSFHHKRIQGFKSVISEHYPKINIVGCYSYDSFKEQEYNMEVLRSMIEHGPQLDGIYDFDGASLYDMGKMLKDIGKAEKLMVVGHEISEQIAQLLRENIIHGVISQNPYAQGYEVIKKSCQYLLKNETPEIRMNYTDIRIIIRENCDV